ncbi:hypothetical protein [Lewinella sp. JB7]|uniref:hypothetical protein n=1 Tax=Lewinella sp. JB7 TaxID=2962887 RepID=UPI0020C9F7DD|nr:hypothetical protein [Lewinella sp. JB7]MCP9236203.1 hypothetical protein [Lewinella sp. JB7]
MHRLFFLLCLTVGLANCETAEQVESSTEATDSVAETGVETPETNHNWQAIDSEEALVATALLAAPEASREGAKVIGYNTAGEFVTLREGTNEFICLADDPNTEGFNAACYHKDLEPFMARGRELRAAGRNNQEIFDIREEEAKSGKLTMGEMGTTLHIYSGPEARYDPATGRVDQAKYRYVVYLPFATAASTGLPESPVAPNHPWIMDPGTHRAHIMISPINGEE